MFYVVFQSLSIICPSMFLQISTAANAIPILLFSHQVKMICWCVCFPNTMQLRKVKGLTQGCVVRRDLETAVQWSNQDIDFEVS